MTAATFDRYIEKLQQNVYCTTKGKLRLTLLLRDICEVCPQFLNSSLSILDVGCGAGHFAAICLEAGHQVCLLDESEEMLCSATEKTTPLAEGENISTVHTDFCSNDFQPNTQYDAICLHGSVEWMNSAKDAIKKASGLIKPNGFMSLLVFNTNRHVLQKGINGHLLGRDTNKKKKLFPPQAQSVDNINAILSPLGGTVLLQSGIRIFQGFFRNIDEAQAPYEHWLQQELQYYRIPPYSQLGQHSHFIWQKDQILP